MNRWMQALIAVLAVIAGALGALEAGLRIDGTAIPLLDWQRGLLRVDPELGWTGRPDATRWIENGDFDVFIEHDEAGFRRPLPIPIERPLRTLVVIGGTTAWGQGVGRGQLMSDWLQRAAPRGVAVRNRAVWGHSLDQIARGLEHALRDEGVHEVVLLVSPDDLTGRAPDSRDAGLRVGLEEASVAARFLSRHWDRLHSMPAAPGGTRNIDLAELARRISEIHDRCREAAVPLVVVYAPIASEIAGAEAPSDTASGAVTASGESLARLARAERVPFLDTTGALRDASVGKVPLYHRTLGTWSHRSHYLAARELAKADLLETLRIDSSPWVVATRVTPDHDAIRYAGRVDRSLAGAIRFDWPGASIAMNLRGDAARMLFGSEDSGIFLEVRVDGEHRLVHPASRSLELVGLGPGPHEVVISQRNDADHPVVFRGLELPSGAELLEPPPRPERRIEVIGSSWATGYGNEGRHYGYANRGRVSRSCPDISRLTDATESFGAIVAAKFGAELHLTARVGKGLLRNFGVTEPRSEDPLPLYFLRTLATRPVTWDSASWIPQVVILNLGENDFHSMEGLDLEEFRRAYEAVLDEIRRRYPEAHIIAFHAERREHLLELAEDVIEERLRAGDERVELLSHPKARYRDRGCQRHPTVRGHQRLAELLSQRIERALDWTATESADD
jgi:lysophospholipase L1-like esterase